MAARTNRDGVELRSSKLAGVAALRGRKHLSFESLDVVDFGAPASGEGARQLNKILVNERLGNQKQAAKACSFRCSEVKDSRKRWNEDKVAAARPEASTESRALAEHLSERQPNLSKIVSRCQPQDISLGDTDKAAKGQASSGSRTFRRAKRSTD